MAKNYTFNEAVQIIANGQDLEAITDIGRRYPVLLHKVTAVTAKAGQEFVDLMAFMPEYLTANKVNSAIKATIQESDGADDEEDAAEAPAMPAPENGESAEWNENMSAKQLWDILGKAGKRKLAKSTKKADLVEACKQAFGAAAAEADDADEEETTESDNPYEGKSAMELFKECKARKIKAAPKKPAKYYVDLLVKDDAAKAEADETEADAEESDDWGEEEETKPAKKATKSTKAAKKEEASDDDDWDI